MVTEKYYKYSQQKMFNRDTIGGIDAYILTAYFVDPKTICSTTNVRDEVGTGLWLQDGADPIADSVAIPMNQADAGKTKWTQGACFPSMGKQFVSGKRKTSYRIL